MFDGNHMIDLEESKDDRENRVNMTSMLILIIYGKQICKKSL